MIEPATNWGDGSVKKRSSKQLYDTKLILELWLDESIGEEDMYNDCGSDHRYVYQMI